MATLSTMLSGAVAAPAPLPFRPARRDGDMPWEEAVDRHRHRLAQERSARKQPWTEAELDAEVDRAVARLMALEAAHLDLLDEGRLDEESPVRGLARLLRGVELETPVRERREWIAEAEPPRLVAAPALQEERVLRRRWERAQAATTKPVKLAVTGPRSFAGALDDEVHGLDVDAAAHTVAEALNPGLRRLAEAGCPALELVEPALIAAAPAATPAGFETVARVLHKVPRETARWLRLVAADAREPWLGPPPPALRLETIAPLLADLPIDGVVLERATALDAAGVIERLTRLRVAVLAVPAEATEPGVVEDAAAALARLAAVTEPGRLVAAVDGGGAAARASLSRRLDWLGRAVRAVG
jgi:methionine synthase II (cobalamin-independent)